ncbi:hypothetical protein F5X96DRAFT_666264 [Biscogniauxia mediterranea]|nr:hypothetical protein F5X96DRAFT_666264 [Biscogniauxia mediterranea]
MARRRQQDGCWPRPLAAFCTRSFLFAWAMDWEEERVCMGFEGELLLKPPGNVPWDSEYFSNMRHLERGKFRPAYHGAVAMAAAVAGLAGGVYGSALRRRKAERADMGNDQ